MHAITKLFQQASSAGKSPCTAEAGAVPLTLPITNPRHGIRRFSEERDDRHNPLTWEMPGLNDRLIKLHAATGNAFSTFEQIACQLSDEFDMRISKSACVGRARRLGLPPRLLFVRRIVKHKAPQPAKAAPIKPTKTEPAQPRNLTLMQLQHGDCRWPFGDEAPFLFCGNPVQTGTSWCPMHRKMVYAR
jgi:GcrA cell cycle regulator